MRSKFACPQVFLQFGLTLCDVDNGVLESRVNSTLLSHFRMVSDIALQPLAGVLKQGYQDCLRQETAHGQLMYLGHKKGNILMAWLWSTGQ